MSSWDWVRWGCLNVGRCPAATWESACYGEGDPDECELGGIDACPGQLLIPVVVPGDPDGLQRLMVVDGKGRWMREIDSQGCYWSDWTPGGAAAFANRCGGGPAILRRSSKWAEVVTTDHFPISLERRSV